MTYTILAADRDRGDVGIGITTGSINVGGLAPFFSSHGDVVTSQAYALREVGAELTRGAERRWKPRRRFRQDPRARRRQL